MSKFIRNDIVVVVAVIDCYYCVFYCIVVFVTQYSVFIPHFTHSSLLFILYSAILYFGFFTVNLSLYTFCSDILVCVKNLSMSYGWHYFHSSKFLCDPYTCNNNNRTEKNCWFIDKLCNEHHDLVFMQINLNRWRFTYLKRISRNFWRAPCNQNKNRRNTHTYILVWG